MKYWLSPKMKYINFKFLNKKLYPNPDIIPVNGDRILWQMLKERKINMFIENSDDPICLTLKPIPKKAKLLE